MIWLHNAAIGETVGVNSTDGYGDDWAEIAAPPPLGRWQWADGAWVAVVPSMAPERLWQLMTLAEHLAARETGDATVAVAFDRINARRAPLALDDPHFVALVWRLVELDVLTTARAAQALAGLLPE